MEIDFNSDVQTVLPLDVGLPQFRVLQVAIHNAVKHSGAKRVDVKLREDSGEIHLMVGDSGRGFDVKAAMLGEGLGLTSMSERVRLVNGSFAIESKPTSRTTIHARVPLESKPSLNNRLCSVRVSLPESAVPNLPQGDACATQDPYWLESTLHGRLQVSPNSSSQKRTLPAESPRGRTCVFNNLKTAGGLRFHRLS